MKRVGVLALQGSSEPHLARFQDLGVEALEVRQRPQLDAVTHLVIPGGESTTLYHLLCLFDMWEPLRQQAAAGELAIFGTCAGAILLGQNDGLRPPRFHLMDVTVERNAYGRQIDSFTAGVEIPVLPAGDFHAVFIRAPRFTAIGPGVEVLGTHAGGDCGAGGPPEPVLLKQGSLLAATFHPELTDDPRLHEFFLEMHQQPSRPKTHAAA